VLPTKQHTSAEYAYLRQSVRTTNAAIVAGGAAKPTSVYSVVRVENSLQVIAHLSEGIPRYWLLDNQALEHVDSELQYGLGLAVGPRVLTDINATSGIHSFKTARQDRTAWTASMIASTAKSRSSFVIGVDRASRALVPARTPRRYSPHQRSLISTFSKMRISEPRPLT
jgi:hypothetical protein